LQNDYAVDDIADRFTLMQMEDVQQADKLKWPEKSDLNLEVKAKNGLLIKIAAAKIDNQTWLKLAAEAPPEKAKADGGATKKDTKPAPKSASQEATELNTQWQGWAYTLADWAYQSLSKRRVDLVKLPEPPKPAAEATKPAESEPAVATDVSNPIEDLPEDVISDLVAPVEPPPPPTAETSKATP